MEPRLAAGRLAVMGVIARHVKLAHPASAAHGGRVTIEDLSVEMPRRRAVGDMHTDGFGRVAPGHGDWATQTHPEPGTSDAAAKEEVHHYLIFLGCEAQTVVCLEVDKWLIARKCGHGSKPQCVEPPTTSLSPSSRHR